MSDKFKTVPLRYLGFGFAIGEAAKYQFSRDKVNLFNSVGSLYVMAHVLYAAITDKTVESIAHAALFQLICSVLIPTVFNYYIVRIVYDLLGNLDNQLRHCAAFLSGFFIIPIMLNNIDREMDDFIKDLLKG